MGMLLILERELWCEFMTLISPLHLCSSFTMCMCLHLISNAHKFRYDTYIIVLRRYVPFKSNLERTPPLPRETPGIWILENFLVQIPPSPGRKAVQMLHPRENYKITALTFQ